MNDIPFKSVIEPFRIKVVEPIRSTRRDERALVLEAAGYNLFRINARDVLVDLLTDSGTGAMSSEQWAAMMRGDESYAGSTSYHRLAEVVSDLTGYGEFVPTHQGRAAERLLFSELVGPDEIVPNNSHFDTTRAHIEFRQAEARDLLVPDGPGSEAFRGNMDVAALERLLEEAADRVPLIMITVTNNSAGGQPVSLSNLRQVAALARRFERPLYLDAARFAENAYLIKRREAGQHERSVREIAREMFSLADGCTMSAKKDALVNIGGFLALRDKALAERVRQRLILDEGFPTYGGLAGRDMEAMAVGLGEVLDEGYLAYREASASYLADALLARGIPHERPVGLHAVYLDAAQFLPQLAGGFPAQVLGCALYLEGGVRGVEVGSVMFGRRDPHTGEEIPHQRELLRLALPRRVYTQSHVDYLIEVIERVWECREALEPLTIVEQSPILRHFTAHFQREKRGVHS